MLVHIQSVNLFFLCYTKADGLFQNKEQEKSKHQGVSCNCYKADPAYGTGVAKALGIDLQEALKE